MKKEIICEGKTIEEAIQKGLKELNVPAEATEYDILTEPKKGFFGLGGCDAKINLKVKKCGGEYKALDMVETLVRNLGLDVDVNLDNKDMKNRRISITGDAAGVLIGHHGETLDSLQYLANLTANTIEGNDKKYSKITVDVENYRGKREETLRGLARRMANRVLKSGRQVTLEPMNPYERRIIHSEIQNIDGVETYSVGADDNRKVVISPAKNKTEEE